MADDAALEPLIAALLDVSAWLRSTHTPHAVIGGVAVVLHGQGRSTEDVDVLALLDDGDWQAVVEAGAPFGIYPRVPDPVAFARKARVLLLEHRPSGVGVDVSLGGTRFEADVVREVVSLQAAGTKIAVIRPEHLIAMKALAGRPKDMADIDGILRRHPKLRLEGARRNVQAMADALEMPEIAERFEALLAGRRGGSRGPR